MRNLAIIDEIEVEFGPGLNVVTGETGAGKSMLVGALRLVLGARGSVDWIRTGADQAEVEALFEVGPEVRERVEAAGVAIADELVVRRVLLASGRTRSYLNGSLTTAAQLKQIAAGLVDITSQHAHHTLVDPAGHLGFLDAFAEIDAGPMREAWEAARAAVDAVAALRAMQAERGEREDLLRFQLAEIDRVGPVAGEEEELHAALNRLRHADQLARATGAAERALYARDGAIIEKIDRVMRELDEVTGIDPALEALAQRITEARGELEDVARELGSYARRVDADPGHLADLEDRRHALTGLSRRYGGSVEAVIAHREKAAAELDELDGVDDALIERCAVRDRAIAAAAVVARELSARRRAAADALGGAITDELQALGMGGARVEVAMAADPGEGELVVDGAALSRRGIDRAEFLIAPNPGEPPRALGRIASGGELSRSLLAIKRVLAGVGPVGLYVFDEVDAGVGGAVAAAIGRKVADVAEHHQVLCITHLPQIAAFAHDHLLVEKRVEEGRTHSDVRRLDAEGRIDELARMLGGAEVTATTRKAAAELVQQGAQRF